LLTTTGARTGKRPQPDAVVGEIRDFSEVVSQQESFAAEEHSLSRIILVCRDANRLIFSLR
jgi:hypothetical protein